MTASNAPWPSPPTRALPRPILGLIAPLYGIAVGWRNRRFDRREGVVELDRPVISVGNLSLGGTGKTPMVARLVTHLRSRGRWPCIAMRGYRGGPDGRSDEADAYRAAFPDLPIVAQPDRTSGLLDRFADQAGDRIDCVILDDGFQHRRLARRLDIVLLDATRPVTADRLFPAGYLREPVQGLARAGAVVITHARRAPPEVTESLLALARTQAPHAVLATCSHVWTTLAALDGASCDLSWLRGRRLVACCGIGNPQAFLAALREHVGGTLVGELVLPDHDPYAADTVMKLIELARSTRAEAIVVTEKDWAKLSRVREDRWPCPVLRPVLELSFHTGERELLDRVTAAAELREDDHHPSAPGHDEGDPEDQQALPEAT